MREGKLLAGMYELSTFESALMAVGELLADRGERHAVVAIGGGALSFLGLIQRSTEDIDLVALLANDTLTSAEPLPPSLATAVAEIATMYRLDPKWMNAEPTSLLRHGLPKGFLDRCVRREFSALTVLFASRFDQIHFKLLAISRPNDKHHADLKQLEPTREELWSAVRWVRTQATGEGSEMELRAALASFGVDLDDA